MPIQLSKGDRKLMWIAAAILVLMISTAIFFGKPVNSERQLPTTYSTASGGAKAAYLLLKNSGYDVQRWEDSPTDLVKPKGKTLILAEPTDLPTLEERTNLKKFVEGGGTLIAAGARVGFYLPSDGIVGDPLGDSWKQLDARSPTSITRAAPQITLAPLAYWDSTPFAIPLYGTGEHNAVVTYRYGQGEVLWMASATPLTNAGLKLPGNLEFLLASVGPPKGNKILWDEYFHGYRRSLTGSISRTPVKWMFLQFTLLAIVIVLTYSRRSVPVCLPPKEVRLSPLEFVRTLGALYQQANAASVAVDIYYHRFRYWLTRRLGLSAAVPLRELETAIRERWNLQDPDLNAILQSCESAPYHTGMPPADALKLFQRLHDYAVRFELFSTPGKEKR